MKKFKIVKHYVSPEEYMYRIYKRENLIFWKWITSYKELETCEEMIAIWHANEKNNADNKRNTPKPELVSYL